MKKLMIVAALVMALAIPASAGHYGDFYLIPAAGHLPGANDTFFQTDLFIQNFNDTETLILDIVVIDAATGELNALNEDPILVPARGSAKLVDLLDDYMGQESTLGALLVGGSHAFAVTSRTYNTGGGEGTYGQTVPGVRDFVDNSSGMTPDMASAYLPGIVNNDEFRTNLGMVVGANDFVNEPLTVSVRLLDENGSQYESTEYTFAPGQFAQMQVAIDSIDDMMVDVASAVVTVTGGNGTIVPYLSVVDNQTGDANFILGNFPDSTPFAKSANVSVFEDAFRRIVNGR